MAAYAALVSLMSIIEQIEHHPRPPISLDKTQVESLTEKVTFLQEFLEGPYSIQHVGEDPLEIRIANAAHTAEDIIESYIVDRIHAASTCRGICCFDFLKCFGAAISVRYTSRELYGLQRVIVEMDLMKKEVMGIKEMMGAVQHQPQREFSISATPVSTGHNISMVGFDDVLMEVMDKLIRGRSDHQTIQIVGMGGIGKTTLACNIYQNQLVVQHFDIRAWVTISQEYVIKEVLLKLAQENGENLGRMNEYEIGEKLYKHLCGRRYLIIIDDVWDIQVWDQLKRFFPHNNSGSRIIITTRIAKLGQLTGCPCVAMNFLDEDTSWDLLCRNVFSKEDCPDELKATGKKIAKNCKGLPLSIVVVGGLLAKSEKTTKYWEHILENLNSLMSLEEDGHCLKILHTSYKQLPAHLKPCFLHLGIFPEDFLIRVSDIFRLWVAEGFLKPIDGKSLEEIAQVYLEELIDRNLVLVEKCNSFGKIKYCKLHDLMRDVCLREAEEQNFLCVFGRNTLQDTNKERCISISRSITNNNDFFQVLDDLKSSSDIRSLHYMGDSIKGRRLFYYRLLKVYSIDGGKVSSIDDRLPQATLRYINTQYIATEVFGGLIRYSSSFILLQTLILRQFLADERLPSEIWKMHQLRHVVFGRVLFRDPPCGCCTNDIVLENLQTLSGIADFKCSKVVVGRIPNIKKLKVLYREFKKGSVDYLNNLENLHKLESFGLTWESYNPDHKSFRSFDILTFPHSLKKLSLMTTHLSWDDLTTKIGSLPLLQVLKLRRGSFIGDKWETVDEGFRSLKFLLIDQCDLKCWKTEATHFPRLEHLLILYLKELKEVPSSIGDIPTLQSLELRLCGRSASRSGIRIQEEQEDLGNVDLKVKVTDYLRHFAAAAAADDDDDDDE